jgi:hypothetical protein
MATTVRDAASMIVRTGLPRFVAEQPPPRSLIPLACQRLAAL